MSLTITLVTPAGSTYDLTADANERYGVVPDDLPALVQQIEDNAAEFDSGTLGLVCQNDDLTWDGWLAGADPTARYPDCFTIQIRRDGVMRWQGDIDLVTVTFDRHQRRVAFTAMGMLSRLARYSAEGVRRAFPAGADWNNNMTSAPALASLTLTGDGGGAASLAVDPDGLYGYIGTDDSPAKIIKVRLSDMSKVAAALSLATGENNITALVIDDAGAYLYAVTYTTPAKVIKIDLATFSKVGSTLSLDSGEDNGIGAAWDSVTQHLYAATNTAPLRIIKVAPGATTPTRVAAITMTPSVDEDYARGLVLDGAAGFGYVSTLTSPANTVKFSLAGNMARVGAISLASGGSGENQATCAAIDVAGGYLYVGCYLSAARVVKVRLSDFSRLAVLTLSSGENEALSLAIDTASGHLFVACNLSAGKIVKVQLSDFTRVAVGTLVSGENTPAAIAFVPARGVVVAATDVDPVIVAMVYAKSMVECYRVSDTDKAWDRDVFLRHILVDNSGDTFELVGNEATILLASGAPDNSRYRIRPVSWTTNVAVWPRRLTSDGPDIATLGLLPGDKLSLVSLEEVPTRVTWKQGTTAFYARPFEAVEQTVEVQFVGPSVYPALTAHEIWVDQDVTRDFTPGDGCVLLTPYHRKKTIAELAALLFAECEVAAADYTVDVPTYAVTEVEYADFEEMNCAAALGKLAEIAGCSLVPQPERYLFQALDVVASAAGWGGALDLAIAEAGHQEQLFAETLYDFVRVEGAEGRSLLRGRASYLAHGLTVKSDWITTYGWLRQVADRLWSLFGGRRSSADVSIHDGEKVNLCLDPSFEGTAALNSASSPWKTNVAAGAGETIEVSTARATHGRRALHIRARGTNGIGVKQTLTHWTTGEGILLRAKARLTRVAGALNVDLYGLDSGAGAVVIAPNLAWSASTEGWSVKDALVTIPATVATLFARVYCNGAPDIDAYVDEISVGDQALPLQPTLLQPVYIGSDQYVISSVSETLCDTGDEDVMEIALLGAAITNLSLEGDTLTDDATPPMPAVTACTASYAGDEMTYDLTLHWPYPDAEVAWIMRTVWTSTTARPDTGSTVPMPPLRDGGDPDSFLLSFSLAGHIAANAKACDFMILFADGRITAPSSPYLLPAEP